MPYLTKNLVKKLFTTMLLNAILPAAYEAAIAELGLDVVAQPKIDVNQLKKVKIGHLLQKLLQNLK